MLAAKNWLDWNRNSGLYVREVDEPGVDTKFIERHRAVLAQLLDVPTSVPGNMKSFAAHLGYAVKPSMVRLRFDPALLDMPAGITEATFRFDELSALDLQPQHVLIVENEVSYLSMSVPPYGVVLWGKGYDADQSASLAWLKRADETHRVRYWGDIDTHGFQILHRVRTHLPNVRSVMMDRKTLLAHEDRWGQEPKPVNARLPNLAADDAALYADLVTGRYGPQLRLEQERIDWAWARRALASSG